MGAVFVHKLTYSISCRMAWYILYSVFHTFPRFLTPFLNRSMYVSIYLQCIPKKIVSELKIFFWENLNSRLVGSAGYFLRWVITTIIYTSIDRRIRFKAGWQKFIHEFDLLVGLDVLVMFHIDGSGYVKISFDVL